jgi:hypothetical protein
MRVLSSTPQDRAQTTMQDIKGKDDHQQRNLTPLQRTCKAARKALGPGHGK